MEFEEAHNNLRAIRLLYALLHNNTLQLQYQFSEDLIERARGLLKSLLDVAVVSVFQTHLKIIATQENVPETSHDQENDVAMPQSDPPATLSRMTPHKDEQSQKKLISEIEVKGSISDDGRINNPIVSSLGEKIDLVNSTTTFPIEYSNVPCKESTLEQEHNNVDISSHVDESYKDKNSPLLGTVHEFQHNSSATGQDQKDDFCNDLLNAMKRIESRMLALQLCSNLASSPKNSADKQTMPEVTNLDRPHIGIVSSKSNDTPKEISYQLVSRGEELRSQGKIQHPVQKLTVTKGVKTKTSEGDGLRIQLNQDDITWKQSTGHRNCKSVVRKNPISLSEADQNQKKKSTEHSYRDLPGKSIASNIARKQPQPHQMVIRPTLLDQRYNEIKVFSHKNRQGPDLDKRGSHKKRYQPQDNDDDDDDEEEDDDDEVEESSSNNYQSSSWTSQQVSANGGGGSSSKGSEDYSLQRETEVSTSGTMVDASYEYSSEESNTNSYTSNDNYNSLNSADSLKSDRYYSGTKSEKKVGGLRRLKNKLGLIFHHHHHHHHYHHSNDDNDDDDDGSIHSNRRQRHSMWSNLQNVFHHKNKHHGVLMNGNDEKRRRESAVARVSHRNQDGQFHRLVEGIMGHMRHEKKQKKPHKGVVKGSRNAPHGDRKNKPNWWKMLQQHRGVKVKNRGRVRKKYTSQKSPKMLT